MKKGTRIAPTEKKGSQKPKRRMKKGWKIVLIILAVLLVIIAAAALYVNAKLDKIHYDPYDGKLHFESAEEEQEHIEKVDRQIAHGKDPIVQKQQEEMEEAMEQEGIEVTESVSYTALPTMEIKHDDNIVNILLIGTDERAEGFSNFARGDSCMILSLNKSTGRAKLVSLERGMGVPILSGQYKGQWDWLTHTFCYGGADLMMQEVRECFRVDVHKYVRVNFGTFRAGINAIGGVDITLTQAEADYLNNMDPEHPVTAGTNHLYGFTALQYARIRKIDSDWTRIKRQRTVIQAAINQTKGLNPAQLDSTLNRVLPLVMTNLTKGEILELVPKFQGVTLEQMTIPASGTYGGMRGMGGRSLYAVDFTANAKILQEFLYG